MRRLTLTLYLTSSVLGLILIAAIPMLLQHTQTWQPHIPHIRTSMEG